MSFPFHTVKKLVTFLVLGIMPLVVFLSLLALEVFVGIKLGLIAMASASIFSALILVIITWKVTDSPFLKMYEGAAFGVLTLDDTGQIDFFSVKYADGELIGKFQGREIREKFNRKFFFYLSSIFGKGVMKKNQKEEIEITLEKDLYNKALFKTEFPILIWNKRLKSFITKEYLHEKDNKELLIALGRLHYEELQKFNTSASTITRLIVDLLGKKLLGGPSWIFWIIVIIVVGVLLWFGWPTIEHYFTGAAQSASSALPEKLA